SHARSASLLTPRRATARCPLTRTVHTSLATPPASGSMRATSSPHCSSASHPTGGVLHNTRVLTVGEQWCAPRVTPGYSSADLRAIGMNIPPAPPCTDLPHSTLVLKLYMCQRFVCLI